MARGKQVHETSAKIIYEGSEADTHISTSRMTRPRAAAGTMPSRCGRPGAGC